MRNLLFSAMLMVGMVSFVACDKKADAKKTDDKAAEKKPAVNYDEMAKIVGEYGRGLCVCHEFEKEGKAEDAKLCLEAAEQVANEFETKYAEALKDEALGKKLDEVRDKELAVCGLDKEDKE